jgi:hypothetical protein
VGARKPEIKKDPPHGRVKWQQTHGIIYEIFMGVGALFSK